MNLTLPSYTALPLCPSEAFHEQLLVLFYFFCRLVIIFLSFGFGCLFLAFITFYAY